MYTEERSELNNIRGSYLRKFCGHVFSVYDPYLKYLKYYGVKIIISLSFQIEVTECLEKGILWEAATKIDMRAQNR